MKKSLKSLTSLGLVFKLSHHTLQNDRRLQPRGNPCPADERPTDGWTEKHSLASRSKDTSKGDMTCLLRRDMTFLFHWDMTRLLRWDTCPFGRDTTCLSHRRAIILFLRWDLPVTDFTQYKEDT